MTGGSSSGGTVGGGTGGAPTDATGGTSSGGAPTVGTGGTSSGGAPTGGTGGTSPGGTGGTSSAGTNGASGTANGGTGGTLGGECGQLKVDYAMTLSEAKECPLFGGTPDCSVMVDNGLECPCKTSAQRSSVDSLARLTSIREQWMQKGCDALVDCRDAIGCATLRGASCGAGQGGDVGFCKDSF